jgi:prolipoprotein diacylglyceryltransferase
MGLVVLLVYVNGRPRRAGILFFTYVIWYGTGRIVTDFLRVENRFFGLTGSQWTSILAVGFSIAMLVRFARRPETTESGGPPEAGTVTVDPDPPPRSSPSPDSTPSSD